MNSRFVLALVFVALFIISCGDSSDTNTSQDSTEKNTSSVTYTSDNPLFQKLPSSETGVTFNNKIDPNQVRSPLEYVNVYNGAGVATGDINNDGLPDIYFTGNVAENKLYLNKGNFQFEDITEKAGVACKDSWSTGVTMEDVNKDGFLDIYVCRGYYHEPTKKQNQLFINNGDLTFTEKSKEYGIGDTGYSITATFFDYDKDGNADLFVGNHPLNRSKKTYDTHWKNWQKPVLETSDHLYRNNGDGTFSDVTKQAGLLNYGWTLGVVAADLNQDDYPDLFVSVDHTEPDRYYENNGDGTFTEVSEERMKHISYFSMGVDAGDINNDGLLDLAVVEMLSTDNFNEKTKMAPMNPERFWYMVEIGYQYQYMRNMLHLNNGNGQFSEIGQMAGIQRTNWSWAALLADFDNDGWKDFFVANGYLREYMDKDHHKSFTKRFEQATQVGQSKKGLIQDYGRTAPVNQVANNFFRNNGNLTFDEKGPEFGLDNLDYSSGAAYADFDNDGDLDLIVNHSNNEASVYKNTDRERGGNNYLRVNLEYPNSITPHNTEVTIETSQGIQYQEFTYTRGYQSSVEGMIHFGLGKEDKINKLTVEWPDGKRQEIAGVDVNQVLTLNYQNANLSTPAKTDNSNAFFAEITDQVKADFKHDELLYDDYKKQVLLPHKMSQFGPFFASADVNLDGLEDFYVGGGNGQAAALYLQEKDGTFTKAEIPDFEAEKYCDDQGAVFVDVNNDQFPDLYVVSGGNEFNEETEMYYQDRLYINVGKGMLRKVSGAIPESTVSGSCVKSFDFDGDGDLDLFVGGRHVPGEYPSPAKSMLLENVKGKYTDVTASKAPDFEKLGMVTDAVWSDFNNDGTADIMIVGEWMPLTIFTQENGQFKNSTETFGLSGSTGWWNRVEAGDIDNDGDTDYVIGNLGWNYKYQASPAKPFHVWADDFDGNGTFDIALGYYLNDDVLYPVRGRQCSSEQIPELADKFPSYTEYGKASIFEVYGEGLNEAIHYEANNFSSSVLINNNGKYELKALPSEAQIAPINGIVLEDFDGDSKLDLLVAGNLHVSEVETGRADAGKGLYMKGNGDGTFQPLSMAESGIFLDGDIKDLHLIKTAAPNEKVVLVSSNNAPMKVLKWTNGQGGDLSMK